MDPEKPEGKAVSCSHALSKSTHIPNVKTTKINNVDCYIPIADHHLGTAKVLLKWSLTFTTEIIPQIVKPI